MIKIVSPFRDDIFLCYHHVWFLLESESEHLINPITFESNVMLFPFLLNPISYYHSLISNQEVLNRFPYREVITAGFLQNTPFWTAKAVEWLENQSNADLKNFPSYLRNIVANKAYDQSTRQKSKRLLAKL